MERRGMAWMLLWPERGGVASFGGRSMRNGRGKRRHGVRPRENTERGGEMSYGRFLLQKRRHGQI